MQPTILRTPAPCKEVQCLALWAVQNVRLGASAPYVLAIALKKEPQSTGALTTRQRAEELSVWQWWLAQARSEEAFLNALRERVGINLERIDEGSANDLAWLKG